MAAAMNLYPAAGAVGDIRGSSTPVAPCRSRSQRGREPPEVGEVVRGSAKTEVALARSIRTPPRREDWARPLLVVSLLFGRSQNVSTLLTRISRGVRTVTAGRYAAYEREKVVMNRE